MPDDVKIIVATHKAYRMPKDKMYLPVHVGAEGKDIDLARKDDLKAALERKIAAFKRDDSHKGSPSLLKHMRSRVEFSVTKFNRYVLQPAP
jgi:hypothetical protein